MTRPIILKLGPLHCTSDGRELHFHIGVCSLTCFKNNVCQFSITSHCTTEIPTKKSGTNIIANEIYLH